MKNLVLIFFLIPSFAIADEINTKEKSNLELFGDIAKYLSNAKNKKDNITDEKYRLSFEELEARAKGGDPSASLYRGFLDLNFCQQAKSAGLDATRYPLCKSAFNNIEFAAKSTKKMMPNERATAYNLLGQIYLDGLGVNKSNLLAASNFYESAVNYNKYKDKDNVLINLEKAINAYPKYQKAQIFLNSIIDGKE